MKKILVVLALIAALAGAAVAAVNLTIDGVRTETVTVVVRYNASGLATGATVSASGWETSASGNMRNISLSWDYATLPAGQKANIRGLVQSATRAMSQEVGETAEVVLP